MKDCKKNNTNALLAELKALKSQNRKLAERCRNQTEKIKSLSKSNQKYRAIFEGLPDSVFIMKDTFIECNRNACHLWKCSREEILGKSPQAFSPDRQPDGRHSFEAAFHKISKAFQGTPQVFEWKDLRSDGSLIDTEVTLNSILIDGEKHVLATVRDITGRKVNDKMFQDYCMELENLAEKRAEGLEKFNQRLIGEIKPERANGEFNQILDAVSNGIMIIDRDKKIRQVSRHLLNLAGLEKEEVIGKRCGDIFSCMKHDSEVCHSNRLLSGSREIKYDTLMTNKRGEPLKCTVTSSPIVNDNGEIIGIVKNFTDLSKREKKFNQLAQAGKMASLGIKISGVAHEINSPNNLIMLNSPLLERVWRDCQAILDDYYENNGDFNLGKMKYSMMRNKIPVICQGILEGSSRIKNIVQSLKNYYRPGSSTMIQDLDLNAALDGAIHLLSEQIPRSTNHFTVTRHENLPKVTGNRLQIEQVLVNLIQNACEALRNREDAISISTGLVPGHPFVFVKIKDTGSGIDPSNMNRLTDPFFTTRHSQGGTGLGLSISAKIVEEHRGKLIFSSSPTKETEAAIHLPINCKEEPSYE